MISFPDQNGRKSEVSLKRKIFNFSFQAHLTFPPVLINIGANGVVQKGFYRALIAHT